MIRRDKVANVQCSIVIVKTYACISPASKYHKGLKIAFYFTSTIYYIF